MRAEQRRRRRRVQSLAPLLREWIVLELLGHLGLLALRQICGTSWSWQVGGPFAYLDVSRAMLHGDFWWVLAVVGTSALRVGLLAEWRWWLSRSPAFGRWAWLPWLLPCGLLGWLVLIRGDSGAAYILALPAGAVFEGYHILFFAYVTARLLAGIVQLVIATGLILRRSRRAWRADGPWPYLPLRIGLVAVAVVACAVVYLHIYHLGGSVQARWVWFAGTS